MVELKLGYLNEIRIGGTWAIPSPLVVSYVTQKHYFLTISVFSSMKWSDVAIFVKT